MSIVLVEPSKIGQKMITKLLELRGHEVVCFEDGSAALDYIRNNLTVSTVLTSFETAGLSGMELCWELRLLAQKNRHLYVIAMSSNSERDKTIEALDSGADDFITKPPEAQELYARVRAGHRLAAMHKELLKMATRDNLTGLLNRGAFFSAVSTLIDNSLNDTPVSAIMLDIDKFKRINDTYGHHVGDEAIKLVAKQIANGKGITGRVGGEEFAIVLPMTTDMQAVSHAENLRHRIERIPFEANGELITLTSSFGVAQWCDGNPDSVSDMMKRADHALYQAKEAGRNRVILSEPDVEFV